MSVLDNFEWRQSCCGGCGGEKYDEAQAANGEWLQLWAFPDGKLECIRYGADKVRVVAPKAEITEAELEALF